MTDKDFDSRWEENVYGAGRHLNQWPSECVISAFHYFRRENPTAGSRPYAALDLGCGAGNNARFLAKSGCKVTAIDGSETAVATAAEWAKLEDLEINFLVGGFLDDEIWKDQNYDFILDRSSLNHSNRATISAVIQKIKRALNPGGWFFSEIFSTEHSDRRFGVEGDDGTYKDFSDGYFKDIAQTFFASKLDIEELYGEQLEIHSLQKVIVSDALGDSVSAAWRVIGVRRDDGNE